MLLVLCYFLFEKIGLLCNVFFMKLIASLLVLITCYGNSTVDNSTVDNSTVDNSTVQLDNSTADNSTVKWNRQFDSELKFSKNCIKSDFAQFYGFINYNIIKYQLSHRKTNCYFKLKQFFRIYMVNICEFE